MQRDSHCAPVSLSWPKWPVGLRPSRGRARAGHSARPEAQYGRRRLLSLYPARLPLEGRLPAVAGIFLAEFGRLSEKVANRTERTKFISLTPLEPANDRLPRAASPSMDPSKPASCSPATTCRRRLRRRVDGSMCMQKSRPNEWPGQLEDYKFMRLARAGSKWRPRALSTSLARRAA